MAKFLSNLSIALLTIVTVGCTGSLPSSGQLPSLNGSQLTNVNASTVGNTSANAVQNAVTLVGTATSVSGTSSLVERDAQGGFSAGTITANLHGSASFALGQQGTDLTAAATLTPGSDGDYFNVVNTNSVAKIDAIAAGPKGARVTLNFTSNLLLSNSTKFQLSGLGNFNVIAGDIFDFVSLGDGTWKELRRQVTNDSQVFVSIVTGSLSSPCATGVYTPIKFDTVSSDQQSEYSIPSGVFTPAQAGIYEISLQVVESVGASPWPAGTGCGAALLYGGSVAPSRGIQSFYPASPNTFCSASVSASVALNANQAVTPYCVNGDSSQSHTLTNDSGGVSYTFLSIARRR